MKHFACRLNDFFCGRNILSVCLSVCLSVTEPPAAISNDPAAASDGLSDKSRPVFKVGDDGGRLPSSAETVVQDVNRKDVQAASDGAATDGGDAVKLSMPKCQPLDAVSAVTTSLIHKSASKYVILYPCVSAVCD